MRVGHAIIIFLFIFISSAVGVDHVWWSPAGTYPSFISSFLFSAAPLPEGGVVGPLHFDYPTIVSRSPANNSYAEGPTALLECVAEDGNWLANITFYENTTGSWQAHSVTVSGHIANASYNLSLRNGSNYWWCEACDAFGYCTAVEPFVIHYNIPPVVVELLSPANGSVVVPSVVTFSCRAESNGTINNITLEVWKDSALYFTNSTNPGGNATFNSSVMLTAGNYTWQCEASNEEGATGVSEVYYVYVVVPEAPHILEAWAAPPVATVGGDVYLYINAIADEVKANITLPNGSIVEVPLVNGGNVTYHPPIEGQYNVTFIARNTTTNATETAEDSFLAFPPTTFTLDVVNSSGIGREASLLITYDGWVYVNTTSSNGHFSAVLPNYTFNVSVAAASANVGMEALHVGIDSGKVLGVERVLREGDIIYGFNASFATPTGYRLYLSYSPLSLPLSIFRCANFSFSNMSCEVGSGVGGSYAGGYVLLTLSTLGEEGYRLHAEEGEEEELRDLEIEVEGECVEDDVVIRVWDRVRDEPVEARVFVKKGLWGKVYYGSEVVVLLPEAGRYSYHISAHGYKPKRGSFTVKQCYECKSNADCGDSEVCEGGQCVEVECPCGYVSGHVCHPFECCEDSDCGEGYCYNHHCVECMSNADCDEGEVCEGHMCVEVECPCGYVVDHSCHAYECCEDAECPSGFVCEEHSCKAFDVDIIAPEEAEEGEEVDIQVLINGQPAGETAVYINGKEYVTDGEGYVTVVAPPEDIVVEYVGRVHEIETVKVERQLTLSVEAEGGEFFKGKETVISLRNSKGELVVGTIEVVRPDGEVERFEGVSSITYIPPMGGKYELRGYAKGYGKARGVVKAGSCELKLLGHVWDYGRWALIITLCWYWWVLMALILALILTSSKKRRKKSLYHLKKEGLLSNLKPHRGGKWQGYRHRRKF